MAVRHGYGKIAGADALVFAYDTGDTVNSYKGEPTVNLVTNANTRTFDNGTDGNWNYQTVAGSGSISTENPKTGAHSAKLTRSGAGGEVNYWWNAGPALSLTPGTTYTFSMDVWCDKPGMAKLFSYLAGTNGSSDYHPGDSEWHRLSMQFSPAADTSNAQIRFGLLTSNNNYPVTAYFDNVQVEQKSHATPFVDGTRSATEGLRDLTGRVTLNTAYASFNSDAQISFDGTGTTNNIYIVGGTPEHLKFYGDHTIEAIVNPDSSSFADGSGTIVRAGLGGDELYGFFFNKYSNAPKLSYEYFDGTFKNVMGTSNSITYDVPNHVAVSISNLNLTFYVNGEPAGSGTITQSTANPTYFGIGATRSGTYTGTTGQDFAGEMPVVKMYNRALTAGEVKNNYSHYKNRFGI